MMHVTGGSTNVTTYFVLRLAADGTEATGLTITNFDLQYTRSGVAPVAKVDATALAATDSAHGDNQAIEIDATDQPGLYRVDWPDAAFAAGVSEVILSVKCATAFTEHLRVMIDPPVNVEKWNGTAVPSEHTAGYPIVTIKDGTGTGEINTNAGAVALVDLVTLATTTTTATNVTTVNGLAAGVITAASIATGAIDADALAADAGTELGTAVWASATRTLTAGTNVDGSTFTAIPWNAAWDAEVQSEATDALNAYDPPTNAEMEARTIAAASYATATAAAAIEVDTQDIQSRLPAALTADGNMKADALRWAGTAITATSIPVATAAGAAGGLLIAGSNAATTFATLTSTGAFTVNGVSDVAQTGDSFARIGATGSGLTSVAQASVCTEARLAILSGALTEAYATDGAAFTLTQALYMIWSAVAEFSISGTTITAKKLDGSTTAMTFTLDSSTTPTSRTRAS